ncbi:MAG: glutamate racemase [Clostridia bacterium]|nr:glutamate racemase [Clostridia bacterium]
MDKRPIGVFDSGLGGLTCVREIMRIMPGEDVIYFGDTGRVPYGTRERETLLKYVRQDIRFLETFDIKMIIIACGTASSAALPWISSEFGTEIIGVVEPAAKAAVKATKSKRIGVLGTSGTVKSGKYIEYIKSICPEAKVFQKACPMFVPLVENGYADKAVARLFAEEYLEEIKAQDVDTLILGCTHYPLLKPIISEIMGEDVVLIDSGAEAAGFALERLSLCDKLSHSDSGQYNYFVSDSAETFAEFGNMFLSCPIKGNIKKIDIEKY